MHTLPMQWFLFLLVTQTSYFLSVGHIERNLMLPQKVVDR